MSLFLAAAQFPPASGGHHHRGEREPGARPEQVSYAATKAALNCYSRAIAHHQQIADHRGISLEQAQRDLAKWLTGAQYRVDGGILAEV